MGRFGLFFGLLWACLQSSPTFSAEFPSRYDGDIQRAVAKWWPDLPEWRWLKAQFYQESRLDPTAVSGVGAEGIAQAMPGTWIDVIRALNWPKTVSRRDAAYAIEGGAFYQMKQRAAWQANGRTPIQRNDLGLASYNAGVGNILKAQKACNDARQWPEISVCLDGITGQYSRETLDYVIKIHRWYMEMQK